MSNVTCPPASVLQPIIDTTRHATYYVVAPCYFFIDLTGHSLLLLAMYQQSKTQPMYTYQVFRAVSEMAQVLINGMYILSMFVLFGVDPAYQSPMPALNNSYAFVWYAAHLAAPLLNSLITTSLLLSASTVADRVFALYKPMIYRSINHKRHQLVAVTLSVGFGFATSVFDCFRNRIIYDITLGSYKAVYDTEYLKSTTAFALALCRVFLQVVSLSVLITLSVCLIFLYRLRFVKASIKSSDQQEEQRKQNEKTLTLLTLFECIFDAVGMCLVMAFYVFAYGFPAAYLCYGKLMSSLLDMMGMIVRMCDFYAIIIVSKQFRKMLRESLRCGKISKNMIIVSPAKPQ